MSINKLQKLDVILSVIGIFCAFAAIISLVIGAIYNCSFMYYFYGAFMLVSMSIFVVAKFIIYKKIIKKLNEENRP